MHLFVETDDRSRVVLPGHRNERFLVTENPDGRLLLEPVVDVSKAQYEYDTTPELQDQMHRATSLPTVRRPRPDRAS